MTFSRNCGLQYTSRGGAGVLGDSLSWKHAWLKHCSARTTAGSYCKRTKVVNYTFEFNKFFAFSTPGRPMKRWTYDVKDWTSRTVAECSRLERDRQALKHVVISDCQYQGSKQGKQGKEITFQYHRLVSVNVSARLCCTERAVRYHWDMRTRMVISVSCLLHVKRRMPTSLPIRKSKPLMSATSNCCRLFFCGQNDAFSRQPTWTILRLLLNISRSTRLKKSDFVNS